MKNLFTLCLSFILAGWITTASAQNPEGFTKVKELSGITEYQLDSNGLTVLLKEDHSAPVLTFMVTYRVGSRNEVTGTTGATHLLEHLMFKGTDKYNKEDGTGIDALLQNKGARLNASTWFDRTNYFENLPSEYLDLAVDIEADRMRNLRLREEDRRPEMTVVRNEFERGENSPFGSLNKEIWATAYQAHPYHHSTIGWKSDIENVPIQKLRDFYDTFYWPNNATVTVIGDFRTPEALSIIKKHYGSIPHSPHKIPKLYTTEPEQRGPRRVTVKRAGQLGVVGIAHKVPEGTNVDTYALSVLNKILTDGKSSRLYHKLVDQGKATNIFTFYFPFHDPGLFVPYAFLAPGVSHEEVEQIILDEYNDIKENGVSQDEVNRAINQITAETAYSRDGSFSMASEINEAIAMGDWTFYVNFPEQVKKVTPEDVQNVVKKYFTANHSTTGYFIPQKPGATSMQQATSSNWKPRSTMQYYRDPAFNWNHPVTTKTTAQTQTVSKSSNTDIADNIQVKNIGAIKVYTMKTGVDNVVTLRGSLPAGDIQSPQNNAMIADMTGRMLDKGTMKNDKFAIAEQLENMGAEINFSVDAHTLHFSARCLQKDLPKVVNLLAEQLREPAFPKDELEKLKKQRQGELKRNLDDPNYMAQTELSRNLFPKGHPNYSPAVDEIIADMNTITVDDLKKFHRQYYGPKNMLLVAVGDIDNAEVQRKVASAFKGWKGGSNYKKTAKAQPNRGGNKTVNMEDKTSVTVMLGIPTTLNKRDKDYLALKMGTYILGGNFSARLMSTVRDEEGLTYGINSFLGGDTFSDGYWAVQATFAPSLLDKGIQSTMKQVNKWIEDGVTQKELDAKKSTISGSYKVRLATTGGMAGQILSFAQQGHNIKYMDQYVKDINTLTLDEVNRAIRKYIKPDDLFMVKAGTIEKTAQAGKTE